MAESRRNTSPIRVARVSADIKLDGRLPDSWEGILTLCQEIDEKDISKDDHNRLTQHISNVLSQLSLPFEDLVEKLKIARSADRQEITQALFLQLYCSQIQKIRDELKKYLEITQDETFPESGINYNNPSEKMAAKILWNHLILIEKLRNNVDVDFFRDIRKNTPVVLQHNYLKYEIPANHFLQYDPKVPFFHSFFLLQCITAEFAEQLYIDTEKKYMTLSFGAKILKRFFSVENDGTNLSFATTVLQDISRKFIYRKLKSQRKSIDHLEYQLLVQMEKYKNEAANLKKVDQDYKTNEERLTHTTELSAQKDVLAHNLTECSQVIHQVINQTNHLQASIQYLAITTNLSSLQEQVIEQTLDEGTQKERIEKTTIKLAHLADGLEALKRDLLEKMKTITELADDAKTDGKKLKAKANTLTLEIIAAAEKQAVSATAETVTDTKVAEAHKDSKTEALMVEEVASVQSLALEASPVESKKTLTADANVESSTTTPRLVSNSEEEAQKAQLLAEIEARIKEQGTVNINHELVEIVPFNRPKRKKERQNKTAQTEENSITKRLEKAKERQDKTAQAEENSITKLFKATDALVVASYKRIAEEEEALASKLEDSPNTNQFKRSIMNSPPRDILQNEELPSESQTKELVVQLRAHLAKTHVLRRDATDPHIKPRDHFQKEVRSIKNEQEKLQRSYNEFARSLSESTPYMQYAKCLLDCTGKNLQLCLERIEKNPKQEKQNNRKTMVDPLKEIINSYYRNRCEEFYFYDKFAAVGAFFASCSNPNYQTDKIERKLYLDKVINALDQYVKDGKKDELFKVLHSQSFKSRTSDKNNPAYKLTIHYVQEKIRNDLNINSVPESKANTALRK